jgi:hypothetical protein
MNSLDVYILVTCFAVTVSFSVINIVMFFANLKLYTEIMKQKYK